MEKLSQDLTQSVRNYIYAFFVDQTRPPAVDETARALGISPSLASEAYVQLGAAHAVFLDRETPQPVVRMAFPFSAAPTAFRVTVRDRTYYANCAWDMFGIPAALHADASIEASCADCQERVDLRVTGQKIFAGPNTGALAHFLLPFRQWYADLIYT